jgi:hypothetical protein
MKQPSTQKLMDVPTTLYCLQQALIGFLGKPSNVKDKDNMMSDYKPQTKTTTTLRCTRTTKLTT